METRGYGRWNRAERSKKNDAPARSDMLCAAKEQV